MSELHGRASARFSEPCQLTTERVLQYWRASNCLHWYRLQAGYAIVCGPKCNTGSVDLLEMNSVACSGDVPAAKLLGTCVHFARL